MPGADDDKTPEQIRREAREELRRIKAERKAVEILRKAQKEQGE